MQGSRFVLSLNNFPVPGTRTSGLNRPRTLPRQCGRLVCQSVTCGFCWDVHFSPAGDNKQRGLGRGGAFLSPKLLFQTFLPSLSPGAVPPCGPRVPGAGALPAGVSHVRSHPPTTVFSGPDKGLPGGKSIQRLLAASPPGPAAEAGGHCAAAQGQLGRVLDPATAGTNLIHNLLGTCRGLV